MENFYLFRRTFTLIIVFILVSNLSSTAQNYQQIEEHKIIFITRYLNLNNQQKATFIHAVKKLDENLAEINKIEKEDPELYLLKLRSLNDIFEVQVKRLLQEDQHGRWKSFQNKEQRAINNCTMKSKQLGWSAQERMKEEIRIRYRYTTLNI